MNSQNGENALVDLKRRFEDAMLDIYVRAKAEANYNATRYLQMLHEYRGLETARILLRAATVSDGHTALWQRGRLDLTVEALVLQPEYSLLFSEREREIAFRRLTDYGFTFE